MLEISSEALGWLLAQSAALVIALVWLFFERRDKLSYRRRSEQLSNACLKLVEESYTKLSESEKRSSDERVKSESTHSLQQESFMRNVLDLLERAASNKPKP